MILLANICSNGRKSQKSVLNMRNIHLPDIFFLKYYKSIITLLRAPQINKKSREQFEMVTYKTLLYIIIKNIYNYQRWVYGYI